jgi:O-antigen/teichoic acid export membrane protein
MGKLRRLGGRILDRLQTSLRIDIRYIARGGFWLAVGNGASSLVLFLLSIAFANLLTKEMFGEYKYILSISGLLASLTLTGTNTSITQAVARGFEGTYVRSIFWQLKWSAFYTLATLATAVYYLVIGNTVIGASLLVISILNPISFAFNTYVAFLNGKKDFKRLSQYNFISSTFVATASCVAMFISPETFLLIVVNTCANALIHLYLHYRTLSAYQPNAVVDQTAFSYAKHLSLINILGTIASQIDNVLIFHFFGAKDLAIYAFATLLPDRLRGFSKILQNLAIPQYARRTKEEIREGFAEKLLKYIFILALISLAYIFVAPFMFGIFFPAYTESIRLSQLYAVSFVASASSIPVALMLAQRQKRNLYFFSATGSLFQIGITSALVPLFGLQGAIIGKILGLSYNLVASVVLVMRRPQSDIPKTNN